MTTFDTTVAGDLVISMYLTAGDASQSPAPGWNAFYTPGNDAAATSQSGYTVPLTNTAYALVKLEVYGDN